MLHFPVIFPPSPLRPVSERSEEWGSLLPGSCCYLLFFVVLDQSLVVNYGKADSSLCSE